MSYAQGGERTFDSKSGSCNSSQASLTSKTANDGANNRANNGASNGANNEVNNGANEGSDSRAYASDGRSYNDADGTATSAETLRCVPSYKES